MICPYFGEPPTWMEAFLANFHRLHPLGYELLIDTDEQSFRDRVEYCFGITCPPMFGTGKVWDFRPALGQLYSRELRDFHFWGHVDFDVVLGRVERWVSEEFLMGLDMHSNCASYVNGSWSLYRNTPQMRNLFMECRDWRGKLRIPHPTGWAEVEFSKIIEQAANAGRLTKMWTQWQVFEAHELARLRFDGERLMCGEREVMMAHFRRTKVYPPGCLA